ncbi:type I restriction-modification system subunit M [Microbulbifer thermotolerans]|uniref:type I restriction-modification system subunit M n=1 Tax=Microbulbifer thermotolerans TaxID=252514 RepID=UPI0022487E5C|nr:type I restriction-modification system subunit M [Microbulbifer thermotolerans]MCX2831257.1 type I restriction-modification system subunit M [Microbulbifer thermotolerans]
MAIKKTELYSSLWASCDELRGGMDASQYKDYVLTLLFMKYVSDKYKGDPYGMIVVPEGASFDDMVALKGDKEIGEKINKIIARLAEENDLKGVIDVADFNDEDKLGKGKEMIDRLSKLVGIFEGLDLSANRADGDDLLGDAYEYLMRHFATESGKSKGQFYTPSEVSQILSKVIGINSETPQDATVYDPTCGSGSLLLKASDQAPRGLSIFGQEMDNATSALARMNMILHNNATAKIWKGNTLSDPQWKEADSNGKAQLKTFDFAVANPPFSNKNWTSGLNPEEDVFGRFEWGIPPEKNGDYAFLLHIIKSLKSTGKGAVILPHGVLFRGNAEARIRENLIKQGYIKGIIGLPANLFYGTGIPACIIVIDKEHSHARRGIFMVDASKGFMKDGNKNRLRAQDIHKIVDVFTHQRELPRYSRMVPLSEIATNDYNLNIPRYIDASEPEDLHDLSAHLQGGIPNRDIDALAPYWRVFPSLRSSLFQPAREGYSQSLVKAAEVKTTILNHPEFQRFAAQSLQPFTAWCKQAALDQIKKGDNPKQLIHRIGEALLESYSEAPLLDRYDIYQILMDYWADTMQDDVYLLVQEGWQAGRVLRELVAKKGEKLKEQPDLVIAKTKYKTDLIPPQLIVARFFADQQAQIDQLQSALDSATQALESYLEENSSDDGLLADALNDKDKITKASVTARLKLATDPDEIAALKQAKKHFDAEARAKKALKEAQEALDLAVFKQYPQLSEAELKSLIVEDKWLATLRTRIEAEIERITQQLANRVKELEERYAEPLPALTQQVESLSEKVAGHLRAMGLEWEA